MASPCPSKAAPGKHLAPHASTGQTKGASFETKAHQRDEYFRAPENWTPEGPSMTCGSDPGSQAYHHLSHGGHSGPREDRHPLTTHPTHRPAQTTRSDGAHTRSGLSLPAFFLCLLPHCPLAAPPVSTGVPLFLSPFSRPKEARRRTVLPL